MSNFPHTRLSALAAVARVYSFWGRHPLLYRLQDFITFLGRADEIRWRAVRALEVGQGARVLEVGCGTGRNFPFILEAIGERGRLFGFEYSHEMWEAARAICQKNGWKNVELIQGDAALLNIPERDFDGVLAVLAVSAIPGWREALRRCRDLLRPGGRLVVCDARLFTNAPFRWLNPLVKAVYAKWAAWDSDKNIPEEMQKVFGNVRVERFNFGTFFIAVSVKQE